MIRPFRLRTTLRAAAPFAVAAGLGLAYVASLTPAASIAGPAPTLPLPTPETLGGTQRWLTHVSTDKPIYKEGDLVYVRGVVLDASSHKPFAGWGQAQVQITGPRGESVAQATQQVQDSVISSSWTVPEGAAGGEYKVVLTDPWSGRPPAERKFEVRAYRPPRLNSQIVFAREGYGPGDSVSATLHTERAEGGIPAGAVVTVQARVDGVDVYQGKTKVDAAGNAPTSFALPKAIERGDGSLSMTIEDGGVVETASKTLPILVNSVDVAIYPEGGRLVAGLPARIYVEARTPNLKPADLEAQVVDDAGKTVASLKTEHEGRGRFELTPERGRRYSLQIVKPSGIKRTFALGEIDEAGAAISCDDDVTAAGQPVRLRVSAAGAGDAVTLTISERERPVATATFAAKATPVAKSLTLPPEVSGVLVATVWDAKGKPLAERLLYRAPNRNLEVNIDAGKKPLVPGGQAELTITTKAGGKPVSAWVGLTVSDLSVVEMLETREQPPRLPVMVLLEDEVRELADAHVYLDPKNPSAPHAVDLLLGTQGWRRFAYVQWQEFLTQHGDAARRALAQQPPPPPPVPLPTSMPPMSMAVAEAASGAAMDDVPMAAAEPPPSPAPQPPMKRPAPGRPSAARKVAAGKDRSMPAPREEPRAAKPVVAKVLAKPADKKKRDMAGGGARARFAEREAKAQWAGEADEEIAEDPNATMVWVREYAHQVRPNRQAGERSDFTETLYWTAALRTDANGVAKVSFGMNDAVTSFRASADAFDAEGGLGAGMAQLASLEPFYLEPKLPLAVTSGDVIRLPLGVVNNTDTELADGSLSLTAPKGITAKLAAGPHTFAKMSRGRKLAELSVGGFVGKGDVVITAKAGNYKDEVTRPLTVEANGFPITLAWGGLLEPGKTASMPVELPPLVVPGSVVAEVTVFPAPLGNLTSALTRLIQEPYGCFEQTSSTSYPLVMAQQYFLTHTGVEPSVVEQSRDTLKRGYDRLRGFECKQDGYEWFGEDPGHEALSAFGLMEFNDMAKVMQVDMGMVDRTRGWLLGKRDGQGGFKNERRALHTWLVDPDLHNGYITWALLESNERGIEREAKAFLTAAAASKNSYVTALGANVAHSLGDKGAAKKLMAALGDKQEKEGGVGGATTSIVGSTGEALAIETTALAALAWLKDPGFAAQVEKAMTFLAASCEGGRYGSTQSTVLALRAILAYDAARAKTRKAGSVTLRVDGAAAGESKLAADAQGAVSLPDVSAKLRPGTSILELALQGGSRLPYAVTVRYNAKTPASAAGATVDLETKLRNPKLAEGAATEVAVMVKNLTAAPIPTPVAIIGIPGGLEVRHDQLKELKKAGRIAAYEVRGRDVVLYWRELQANQKVELPVSVIAAVPGTYTGPASRAYPYYTDEQKKWVAGLAVEITAKP